MKPHKSYKHWLLNRTRSLKKKEKRSLYLRKSPTADIKNSLVKLHFLLNKKWRFSLLGSRVFLRFSHSHIHTYINTHTNLICVFGLNEWGGLCEGFLAGKVPAILALPYHTSSLYNLTQSISDKTIMYFICTTFVISIPW